MHNERYSTAVSAVFLAFGVEATVERLGVYWMALSDVPIDAIEHACMKAIRESKRLPFPAELRELCGAQSETPEGAALIAWDTFSRAASDIGSYKSVNFQDRTINAVVRSLGGWPELLARSPEEFDKWVRKDFLTTYKVYSTRSLSDEAYAPLGGLSHSGVVNTINGEVLEYEPTVAAVGIQERKQERLTCQPISN